MATGYNAGSAYLQIIPSFDNIEALLRQGVDDMAKTIGERLGEKLPNSLADAFKKSENPFDKAGKDLAKSFGEAFSEEQQKQQHDAFMQGVQQLLEEEEAKTKAVEKVAKERGERIAKLEDQLSKARSTKAKKDADGWRAAQARYDKAEADRKTKAAQDYANWWSKQLDDQEAAERKAEEARLSAEKKAAKARVDIVKNAVERKAKAEKRAAEEAAKAAAKAAAAQEKADQAAAKAAEKAAKARQAAHDKELREKAAEEERARKREEREQTRAEQETLRRQQAFERAEKLATDRMLREKEKARKAQETADRRAALERVRAARQAALEQERIFQESTPGKVQSGLGRAANKIQVFEVRFEADDKSVEAKLQRIRDSLSDLSKKKLGINLDEKDFIKQVQGAYDKLVAISKDKKASASVRLDSAEAAMEAAKLLAMFGQLDGRKLNVKVDLDSGIARMRRFSEETDFSLSRLGHLIALSAAFGSVLVPMGAAGIAAMSGIAVAAAALVPVIGVLVLGFSGIGNAVKALGKAEEDAAKRSKSFGQSQTQIANAVAGVASARRALAKTIQDNKDAALDAARRVKDAERDLAKVIRDTREAAAEAARRVKRAEEELAETRRRVAREAIEADRRVRDSQKDLAETRREVAEDAADSADRVREAQESLNEAYKEASKAYDELANKLKQNSLDQRQAILDIATAKEELDALIANPRASEAEIEQARINYERRQALLEQLADEQGNLQDEQDEATAGGIEGTKQVRDAQKELQDALKDQQEQQRQGVEAIKKAEEDLADSIKDRQEQQIEGIRAIKDAQQGLADSIRDQQRQQRDGVESIAEAERGLADARRDQQRQQRDAAYSLIGAQESLAQSQRALKDAYAAQATAGGEAYQNLQDEMSKLSPTAQRFARFIYSLKDRFLELRAAASDGMLSGLQTAIENLLPYFPQLRDFVAKVSKGLGDTFVKFSDVLQEPIFKEFFSWLDANAVPVMMDLFEISMNLLRGFVGLFMAFVPVGEDATDGFVGMSKAFADWALNLRKSEGFQKFIDYIRDVTPDVLSFFGQFFSFAIHIIKALAPLGPIVLKIVEGFMWLINQIPPVVLIAIAAGIAAVGFALSSLSMILTIVSIVMDPFLLAIIGIAAGVAILIAGITALIAHSPGLQAAFGAAWDAIVQGVKDAIAFLQPTWDAVARFVEDFVGHIIAFGQSLMPFFGMIGELVSVLWKRYLQPFAELVGTAINGIAEVLFGFFQLAMNIVFKPLIWMIEKILAPVVLWLWKWIFSPVFESIGVIVEIVFKAIELLIGLVVIAFKALGRWIKDVWNDTIKPALEKMGQFFEDLYNNSIKWAIDLAKDAFELLGLDWDGTVKSIKDGIDTLGDAWTGFVDLLKNVAKAVLVTFINETVIGGYNKLAKNFGVKEVGTIPVPKWVASAKGFHTGGEIDHLPGYNPGFDNHTFFSPTGGILKLSGGEGIMRPELTAYASDWLADGNAAARRGGVAGVKRFLGGYHTGGVLPGGRKPQGDGLGDVWKKIKNVGKDAWAGIEDGAHNLASGIQELISDPIGTLKKVFGGVYKKVVANLPGGDSDWMKLGAGLPMKAIDWVGQKIKDTFNFFGSDEGGGSGPLGDVGGGRGWRWQMQVLRQKFPGLDLYSGYRNSRTRSGALSWHARDGGRAVDIPPRHDVFNFIHDMFGKGTQELIWLGDKYRNIHHGKHHVFDNALLQQHGVAGMPNAHIHWAYDQGGWLPDTRKMPGGTMQVFHGRNKPDAVLTNEQWMNVGTLIRQVESGIVGRNGDTYNFDFAQSTLTPERLASLQQRREMLNRTARPR